MLHHCGMIPQWCSMLNLARGKGMTVKTAGIEFLREEFAGLAWDKYDPWGCVTSSLFDLCEAWYGFSAEVIPGYQPSPGFQDNDWESERSERIYGAMMNTVVSEKDMLHWLDVLNRMYGLVKLAGRDY